MKAKAYGRDVIIACRSANVMSWHYCQISDAISHHNSHFSAGFGPVCQ